MSQNQRFRRGNQKVASGKIKAGTKAEIGDLMFRSSDEYLYPASTIAVDGSGSGSGGGFTGGDALTNFKGAFAGTLIEGATGGDETEDSDCLIGYDAVYEYDLSEPADGAYPIGYAVEAFADDGALLDQTVALVAARTDAFGLLAAALPEGATTAYIQTQSSVMDIPLA